MPTADLILLVLLFFVTSAVGVVTGSNSLITVPAMFQFGIEPRAAVATNMFGLTFMAVGATIPFLRRGAIDVKKISPLVALTAVGSAIGAALVEFISDKTMPIIVSVSMIAVSVFTLVKRDAGAAKTSAVSRNSQIAAYILTFALAIYGGLYSGGYVTMLTALLVAFYGMTFAESIAATKLINVFSSSIASAIFMWQGLVDYRLGLILGATMFVAAYVGAHTATRMNEVWLKRIFLFTVLILALKTIYDFTLK